MLGTSQKLGNLLHMWILDEKECIKNSYQGYQMGWYWMFDSETVLAAYVWYIHQLNGLVYRISVELSEWLGPLIFWDHGKKQKNRRNFLFCMEFHRILQKLSCSKYMSIFLYKKWVIILQNHVKWMPAFTKDVHRHFTICYGGRLTLKSSKSFLSEQTTSFSNMHSRLPFHQIWKSWNMVMLECLIGILWSSEIENGILWFVKRKFSDPKW